MFKSFQRLVKSLTIFLAEAVCFSVLSHCPEGLHQLLVGWTGDSPEPCLEHLPFAGLGVSVVVLLDHIQVCILHPQLQAYVIPLYSPDKHKVPKVGFCMGKGDTLKGNDQVL